MEKQKHTPGPWEAHFDGKQWKIGNYKTYAPFAFVPDTDKPNTKHGANARLIAAAPETAAERDRLREINKELLTFAKQYLRHLGEDMAGEEDEEHPAFETMKEIVAAIAKAEQA